MGREVRMVPANWEHPRYTEQTAPGPWAVGRHVGMMDGDYTGALADWEEESAQWSAGFKRGYGAEKWVPKGAEHGCSFEEWCGERPKAEDYMPQWPAAERTHLMMYETTSEGTPISPAFATAEELAHWLADTGASAFGDMTASYEQWLGTIRRGFAVSAVMVDGKLDSGVATMGGEP